MRFHLLFFLRFAASANPPTSSCTLPGQKRVYGRELLRDERPSENEVALGFKKDSDCKYYYPKEQVQMLGVFTEYLEIQDPATQPLDDDSFPMPDSISKRDLDTVMNTFENDPVIDMLDPEAFSHILEVAQFLGIVKEDDEDPYLEKFISCVCRHSILGTHSTDILNTRLYSEFQSSVEQGNIIYTHLARALANVLGLQVKILEEKSTLLLHTPSYQCPKEHRVLGFGASIHTIKITPAALSKIRAQDGRFDIIV